MKAIGFHLGQFGDLAMVTVIAKVFKNLYPESFLTLGVSYKYQDILPLFEKHPFFNDFHIYNSYDNWPSQEDKEFLEQENYDIVFNGMPKHWSFEWFKYYHQTQEACIQQNLPYPDINNCNCVLNQWFELKQEFKNHIAFAPFGGFYRGLSSEKILPIEKSQEIINDIVKLGYKILLLGGKNEPKLENCDKLDTSYFESVANMLSCKALIHTDTGIGWVASAYQFPCLGLYSNSYYTKEFIKNIQPINKNAKYLDEFYCRNIENEVVISNLKDIISNE